MLFSELLIGEPEGGNTPVVADPPAPASADPEPEASAPDPVEAEEAAPVEVPAEDGEQPAEATELSSEDRQSLIEYLRETDEYKAAVAQDAPKPKAEPAPERAKAADPFYQAITSQADDSYRRISEATRKLAAGELESADDLLADIAVTGAWQAASERRGHIAVNRAVIERALGIENGQIETGNGLHDQYDQLLTSLETAQQAAARARANAVREYDSQRRADILTRAEIMDANAVGNFYHQTINLAVERGKQDGKAEAEKGFSKRAPALAEKARTNGHTEAIAKAKQTVLAGKAMTSATEPGKTSKSHTWAEIQKMDEAQINALPAGEWDRAFNEGGQT